MVCTGLKKEADYCSTGFDTVKIAHTSAWKGCASADKRPEKVGKGV